MSITLDFDLAYEFEVETAFKEVFEVLADVPTLGQAPILGLKT